MVVHEGPFTIPGPATNAVVVGGGGSGLGQSPTPANPGTTTTLTFPGTPVTYSAYRGGGSGPAPLGAKLVDQVVVDHIMVEQVKVLQIQHLTQVPQNMAILGHLMILIVLEVAAVVLMVVGSGADAGEGKTTTNNI